MAAAPATEFVQTRPRVGLQQTGNDAGDVEPVLVYRLVDENGREARRISGRRQLSPQDLFRRRRGRDDDGRQRTRDHALESQRTAGDAAGHARAVTRARYNESRWPDDRGVQLGRLRLSVVDQARPRACAARAGIRDWRDGVQSRRPHHRHRRRDVRTLRVRDPNRCSGDFVP